MRDNWPPRGRGGLAEAVNVGWRAGQLVVGEPGWPVAAEHPYCQVLVNDDHLSPLAGSVLRIGFSAAEQRISRARRVEGSLELSLEVSGGQAAQQRSICVGKRRVTSPPPPPAFLQQLLTDAHPIILPSRPPVRNRRDGILFTGTGCRVKIIHPSWSRRW